MAISFDETDDYISVADVAGLTFPNGDWCIGFWVKVDDNTGTLYQYLFSNRNLGANGSLNIYINEASEPTDANKWAFRAVDALGTDTGSLESSAVGADGKWRLVLVQRRTADSEIQMWFCEPFATATKEIAGSDASFTSINGLSWNIGRRNDGDVNRYYGSLACEHFCGDFSLSQAQIELLGKGISPLKLARALGQTLKVYLPMWDATTEAVADLSNTGNDGTLSGTPVKAGSHAPIMLMTTRWPTLSTVLAVVETISVGGTVTPAGVLRDQAQKVLVGTVTPTGAFIRQTQKVFTGLITPAGNLIKEMEFYLSGNVTPAGALANIKVAVLNAAGAVTPTGTLILQAQKVLSGLITPVGNLAKQVQLVLSGAVAPAGVLISIKVAVLNAAGTIIPAGTLILQAQKVLSGLITPVGNLIKEAGLILSGSITLTGAVGKLARIMFSGAVGISGLLTNIKVSILTVAGAVMPAGALNSVVNKVVAGTITPAGAFTRQAQKVLTGLITPAGMLIKQITTSLSGSLALAGALITQTIIGGAATAIIHLTLKAREMTLSLVSRVTSLTLKNRN